MTPHERFTELWNDFLEGELAEAGYRELQALLASDEELRRRAADLYQTHRLLGFVHQDNEEIGEAFVQGTLTGLRLDDESFVGSVLTQLPKGSRTLGRGMLIRTIVAVAAGLLVGVAITSAAWAVAGPWQHKPPSIMVLADSFEDEPAPDVTGAPTMPNNWSGDFTARTAARQGVSPADGRTMLQMLRADYEAKPNPDASYCGDLYRLIDLRPYQRELEGGTWIATLSAVFNAAPFPENEQYGCSLSLHALTAEMATNPTAAMMKDGALAMARNSRQRLDRDVRTWQRIETDLRLAPDAEFLLIHLGINHTPRFQKRLTFDGHFLDDVRLTLSRRADEF